MATSWRQRRTSALVLAISVVLAGLFFDSAEAKCYCMKDCAKRPNAITTACTSGICEYTCETGWSNCDNNWTNGCEKNTYSDVNACGQCGRQCIPYHVETVITTCVKGTCTYTCKAGLSDCNNWLNDGCESRLPYNDDLRFCGSCTTPCLMDLPNAVSKCTRGVCGYTCNPGWVNCDNNWANGCEKRTSCS
ncbi:uncharacterized protein [Physcomitrium patens]|uniref:TNFR-Cys domain-containing protein n=1 Tax=Physcomitrium patens TaxID=3218 RepID=A9T4J9_PHYPA|nr:uncharacterized protein LOC112281147 [Physcomitrium patens]PNR63445.1 hypothetical protein PHYPA_001871 [Physcomitrium patens]|eukprot:XP_024373129.1 uncharacterized protein LOC112281147 [Physcomitrella patens]